MALQRLVRTDQWLLRNAKAASSIAAYSSKSAETDIIGGKSRDYIGIDVGSSNIYVSTVDHNTKKPLIIGKHASLFIPTHDPCEINPVDVVFGCKLLLYRKFNDPLIPKLMQNLTYKISQGLDGEAFIQISHGQLIPPALIFSSFLQLARKEADLYLGKSVSRAVITYPAFFSTCQLRKMLKVGLSTAGLDLIHTIDEATATAFAYGMNNEKEGSVFVVIDMGGKTFDVSVLQVSTGGHFKFKAPTKSDLFLGGDEFDNALADYLLSECFSNETESLIRNDKLRVQGLRKLVERYKMELSSEFKYMITLCSMGGPEGESAGEIINITLTRSKFESVVNHLIEKIKNHIQTCLKEADITAVDVDEVLLVGGMSRVPIVRKVVSKIFGKSPSSGLTNPDEAVALGAVAAVQAGHFGQNPWND